MRSIFVVLMCFFSPFFLPPVSVENSYVTNVANSGECSRPGCGRCGLHEPKVSSMELTPKAAKVKSVCSSPGDSAESSPCGSNEEKVRVCQVPVLDCHSVRVPAKSP